MLLIGNIGVIALGDYLASEWMWGKCGGIVGKYSQYSRQYMVDEGQQIGKDDLDILISGFGKDTQSDRKLIRREDRI